MLHPIESFSQQKSQELKNVWKIVNVNGWVFRKQTRYVCVTLIYKVQLYLQEMPYALCPEWKWVWLVGMVTFSA